MENTTQFPQPKTYGPLGSLPILDKDKPLQSFMKLARELGPVFNFNFLVASLHSYPVLTSLKKFVMKQGLIRKLDLPYKK